MPSMNDSFYERMKRIFSALPGNQVHLAVADRELNIFELPLMGVSDPADPLYAVYKRPEVIGESWMSPAEWLPEVRSVVSFFFPFTEEIRRPEREKPGSETTEEWLYGRIEGQSFVNHAIQTLAQELQKEGIVCCVPTLDPRFGLKPVTWNIEGGQDLHMESRWSERHAAFASGLGTFSVTRAIITEKGCAGRLTSIITDLPLQPTPRKYHEIYENCIHCGACIARCPVNAIAPGSVKNNMICYGRIQKTQKEYAPRYGCGKCQTGIPCESRNPLHSIRRKTAGSA